MKIFISWSGKDSISQKVAVELSKWLPMIIQSIDPWVSTGITAGERWNESINKSLTETSMGIICVTKENINASWLNFEAGAIAKGISNNKVIPLLINLKPSDLTNSPLAQFQAKSLEKTSMKELLSDINSIEKNIAEETLEKLFEHCWDDFINSVDLILTDSPVKKGKEEKITRPTEEILEEVLSLSREIRNDLSYKVQKLENAMSYIVSNDNMNNYKQASLKNDPFSYKDNFSNKLLMDRADWPDESKKLYLKTLIKILSNNDMDNDNIIKSITNNYGFSKEYIEKLIKEFNIST